MQAQYSVRQQCSGHGTYGDTLIHVRSRRGSFVRGLTWHHCSPTVARSVGSMVGWSTASRPGVFRHRVVLANRFAYHMKA